MPGARGRRPRAWSAVAGAALLLSACSGTDPSPADAVTGRADGATTTAAPAASLIPFVAGPPSAPTPVRPPAGHPLERVDRDAGVSARLRDGSVVWFFGDTAERKADGSLRYFEIGSAAWAPAATPTVTRDAVVGGRAVPFATPTSDFPPCPPEAPNAGLWPLATVVLPDGDLDRVVVWMQNICLGEHRAAAGRGTSVGEWTYDPADPPDGRPVTVTVLDQELFPDDAFGDAVVRRDGWIYAYGCDAPRQPEWPSDAGPCRLARVRPADVADADRYERWSATGWSATAAPAPLVLLDEAGSPSSPPGPLSVAWDGRSGAWVMLYTPWPGYTDRVAVRTAPEPQGPWSTPATFELPGCDDRAGAEPMACYAANLQPLADAPGRLGFGWYDRMVEGSPLRGAYEVASVPFEVRSPTSR